MSRRVFLQGAAALAGAVAFPAVLPRRTGETPLRHVVLLMQENRSFDHYFGRFPGADGLPPAAPAAPAATDCLGDPPHDEAAFRSLARGAGFPAGSALTYFTEQQLPLGWALARRFTLCDRYFASVLGPTFSNRLFSIAASPGGFGDNPAHVDPALLPRPTIVDRLDAAGVDWACYEVQPYSGYNPVAAYPERTRDKRAERTFADFLADAAGGRLPAVSWVVPQDPLTEHPPTPPQWGQRFAALAVNAVASGPRWRDSAIVLNYDESGGFYDHVEPPRVDAAGYGYRVPCIVASPYAVPGHVSHQTYDHASVLALVERTFRLAPLAARDAAAGAMEDCFDFGHPTLDPIAWPSHAPAPDCGSLPGWAARLLARPLPGTPASASGPTVPWELAAGLGGAGAVLGAGAGLGFHRRSRRAR